MKRAFFILITLISIDAQETVKQDQFERSEQCSGELYQQYTRQSRRMQNVRRCASSSSVFRFTIVLALYATDKAVRWHSVTVRGGVATTSTQWIHILGGARNCTRYNVTGIRGLAAAARLVTSLGR